MNMKEYIIPVCGVTEVIHSSVVCNSYDPNHLTEILLTEEEETI